MGTVHGIHHVTCIAGHPQENIDFYLGVLGMRLVKKSVNQDDPGTYHLFYADAVGTPGTDLTFFPWPQMQSALPGIGQCMEVPFAIAPGSLAYWVERFDRMRVPYSDPEARFGETALPFKDPHGLPLALVESNAERPFVAWDQSPVPVEHQFRGMHSVRLWQRARVPTEALITNRLGFQLLDEENGWIRYGVKGGGPGKLIDVQVLKDQRRGQWGTGSVHHVAWRTENSEHEMALRAGIQESGLNPTPQIDRFWFKSVYFKEPGGVLFELATDGPGFEIDEDQDHLGEKLILPPWLEAHREQIESKLPALNSTLIQQDDTPD